MKKKGNYVPQRRHNPEFYAARVAELKKNYEKLRVAFDHKYQALDNFLKLIVNFASHDIKNAVHNLDGMISTLPPTQISPEDLADMKMCVDNIRETLDKFGEFSIGSGAKGFDVGSLFKSIELLHRSQLRMSKVEFKIDYVGVKEEIVIEQHFHTILNMLNNMVINSLTALKEASVKKINFKIAIVEDEQVEIIVSDTGSGISPSIRHKIFDPYFSTKDGGSGVGLTHVKYVSENICNGKVLLLDEPKDGFTTSFQILIPLRNDTQSIDN
jgi:signal transduction histidine kinase